MKTLFETTTGSIASKMRLDHCGEYAGEFLEEALDILNKVTYCHMDSLIDNEWADIMYDENTGNVYAICAEDALTCRNASMLYIQIDFEDCPSAFKKMKEKNS